MSATILEAVRSGRSLSDAEAKLLANFDDTAAIAEVASELRDQQFNNVVTYSRKVFIPLTHLCRDVCHYCTFAKVPRKVLAPYMSIEEVLELRSSLGNTLLKALLRAFSNLADILSIMFMVG